MNLNNSFAMLIQEFHKNTYSAEHCPQASEDPKFQTPILRLREFVDWAKGKGLCRSEFDFERQCSLSPKYITNNMHTGKGNIGSEMLGRIIRVYPQLNLAWICTGDEQMLRSLDAPNIDYRRAYEGAMMQIEALNRILQSRNV